jgi:hypothetical protein
MSPKMNSSAVGRLAVGGGIDLRRRDLLRAACAMGGLGIAGCGGGGEEGEDVFTFDVKLLNAAALEEAVTVSSGGRTYFQNLPYGQIGTVQLQEDDFVFDADITVKGLTSGTESTLRAVSISPAFFLLLSADPGNYLLNVIGGMPSPYSQFGQTLFSNLYNVTNSLGEVEVFALAGTGTELPAIGRLKVGASLPIPAEAVAAYKLVFAESGVAIYASGPREKPADSLLIVMRTAPTANPASTWGVYLVDSGYRITRWENTRA